MGKLVRDRIPEIIRESGRDPVVSVLEDAQYSAALEEKLREEVDELLSAAESDRLEEAADIYEVLNALVGLLGASMQEVKDLAEAKRASRGGFDSRLWLEQ